MKLIKLMELVFINILMLQNIDENWQKKNKKEKVLRSGLMNQDMQETISKSKNLVKYIFNFLFFRNKQFNWADGSKFEGEF